MTVILNGSRILANIDGISFSRGVGFSPREGLLWWDINNSTLSLGMPGGNVSLQVGQELYGIGRVRNESGVDIKNGQAVRVVGGSGSRVLIALADNTAFDNSCVVGLATEDIDNNAYGYVATAGLVRGDSLQPINTISYPPGTILYLDSTPGSWTDTAPEAPSFAHIVGKVIRQHASEGIIIARSVPIVTMELLSDVYISGLADGHILHWVAANNRWENVAP